MRENSQKVRNGSRTHLLFRNYSGRKVRNATGDESFHCALASIRVRYTRESHSVVNK